MIKLVFCLLFVVYCCAAIERPHCQCSLKCKENYKVLEKTNICTRGCRFYGLVYLTSSRFLKKEDVAKLCLKSCESAHPVEKDRTICEFGCKTQETVYKTKKPGVQHGFVSPVLVHGMPQMLQKFWGPMTKLHEHMRGLIPHGIIRHFQIIIHSTGKGSNKGQVQVHVESMPFEAVGVATKKQIGHHHPGHHGHGKHHGHRHHYPHEHHFGFLEKNLQIPIDERRVEGSKHHYGHHHHAGPFAKVNAWFHHMPHGAKVGLRWGLCTLLIISVIGLLWLCCATLTPRRKILSITKVFEKKPPQIQSGDIFYVDVDKKPLLDDDELATKTPLDEKA